MWTKENIPIRFEHQGQGYEGYFSPQESTTGYIFQAIFRRVGSQHNYYCGMLIFYRAEQSWVFHANTPSMKNLADWFGQQIIAWVQ